MGPHPGRVEGPRGVLHRGGQEHPRFHVQRQAAPGEGPQAADVVERPARSRLQRTDPDRRRADVRHRAHAHPVHLLRVRQGRDQDVRLPEEAAPERAGLHEERRRVHDPGRARPGHRLHRPYARRDGGQEEGLRHGRDLSARGRGGGGRGCRAREGRAQPRAGDEVHRLDVQQGHAGPARPTPGVHAPDAARCQHRCRRRRAHEGGEAAARRPRVGRQEPQAARRALGERGYQGVRRDPVVAPAVLLVWGAVALFILYPLGRLLVLTFWNDGPSLDAVRGLVGDWTHRAALVNSLLLAALVGIAGTVLGFAFALLAVRANLPRWCSRALDAVVLLPLISPPFTAAIALIFALGPRGLISYHVFGLTRVNIYGLWGTLLSETLTYFPIAYLTLKAVLANVDANLEDSAFSLGARRWRVFRTVTLPLTTPGVANAFLLVSAASLADFTTPLILAGTRFPVLPTQAFLQITGLYDMRGGAALCFLLLVPALAVFAGQRWFTERRGGTFVTVTGKVGAVTRVKSLSPAAVLGLAAGCGLVVVLVLVCYLLIFAASIVRGLGADNSLSLAHYAHVFSGGLKAVRDTLIIAAICMPVGGLFAVVLGFLVARTQFPGRPALEFVAMMNYVLAGMTVLFIRGMTAISATIFLVSLDWSLVTIRILEGITNLELGQASAFSMVVIALVYLAVFVASLAMRRLNAGSLGQAGTLLGG